MPLQIHYCCSSQLATKNYTKIRTKIKTKGNRVKVFLSDPILNTMIRNIVNGAKSVSYLNH